MPAPYTRSELNAAVAAGRWICVLGPRGETVPWLDPTFSAALAVCVAAAIDGGPWRAVIDNPAGIPVPADTSPALDVTEQPSTAGGGSPAPAAADADWRNRGPMPPPDPEAWAVTLRDAVVPPFAPPAPSVGDLYPPPADRVARVGVESVPNSGGGP